MRRSTNSAWLDKLMVSMKRRRKMPQRHQRLKSQLALNRGKAIGLPREYPNTRYQERLRADRHRRWMERALETTPF